MKRNFIYLLSCLACLIACNSQESLIDYVDPNIGTVHSRWFVYTPASEPFGMAKLGASTNGTYGNKDGWEAVGYEDTHTSIDGFPCFHEMGLIFFLLCQFQHHLLISHDTRQRSTYGTEEAEETLQKIFLHIQTSFSEEYYLTFHYAPKICI